MNYVRKANYNKGESYQLIGNNPDIEAIQWKGNNEEQVVDFSKVGNRATFRYNSGVTCNEDLIITCLYFDRLEEKVVTLGTPIRIPLHDYLIRIGGATYIVCSRDSFRQLFKKRRLL